MRWRIWGNFERKMLDTVWAIYFDTARLELLKGSLFQRLVWLFTDKQLLKIIY